MSPPLDLDGLLSQEPPRDGGAAERVLAAARGELALRRPVRHWRTQAVWLMAASGGLALVVALVMLAVGAVSGATLLGRAHLLVLLLGTSAICAWGALSPRGRGLRRFGVVLAMTCAAVLVLARGTPHSTPTLPGWVCTASHVAVGLVPLVVAVLALRAAVFDPLRALVAGLAVGTTGAFLGELACAQDWRHVAGHHLLAWSIVAAASLVISKSLKPRSYAP
ncbi:DUF1109 domain-containing protein [Pyxidicoccus fallax]|uniref:DUF1109 domain-containing protein n=1 Tax=Pyxidicoccus fallax TaxID=394095 RepID=A0A848LD76_9BACT|nr:DUF1109 domain-containing protein [Pyxidicoccus fallax]NMO14765.1 DUF1109 domain-containing protein [Pyxidicoccus fallax]NPC84796.1 DUF1109 domain-containing protein [Pyxidicoccus fallax]